MLAFFSCLHCHRTDPICLTYEQKIGIGSHLTDSVNVAQRPQHDDPPKQKEAKLCTTLKVDVKEAHGAPNKSILLPSWDSKERRPQEEDSL